MHETLSVEVIGHEVVKLVRKGWRFRIVATPRLRVQASSDAVRREFRNREVAWRAFEFVVASERLWEAPPRSRRELLQAVTAAGRAFRLASMKHRDPPGIGGLREVVEAGHCSIGRLATDRGGTEGEGERGSRGNLTDEQSARPGDRDD
jgi:hypothetical protein